MFVTPPIANLEKSLTVTSTVANSPGIISVNIVFGIPVGFPSNTSGPVSSVTGSLEVSKAPSPFASWKITSSSNGTPAISASCGVTNH